MSEPDAAATPTDAVQEDRVKEHEVSDEDENVSQEKNDDPQPVPPDTPAPMPLRLADLPLHSPSSVIVGTPFSDIHSARFEYPFPDPANTSPEIPASSSPPHDSPTFPSSSSSALLSTTSQPQLILNTPPALHHYPASFPPPAELPNYSPTHPKMRAVSPPVPPALVKRRQRWTLGLGSLGRKLSLRGASAPAGSSSPASPDADHSHRRAVSDDKPIPEGSST